MNKTLACLLVGFMSLNPLQSSANVSTANASTAKVQLNAGQDDFADEQEFSETDGMTLSVGVSGFNVMGFNGVGAQVVGSYTVSSLYIGAEIGAGYAFDASGKQDGQESFNKDGFSLPAGILLGYNAAGNIIALFAKGLFGNYDFEFVEGSGIKTSFFKGLSLGLEMHTQVTPQLALSLSAGYNFKNSLKDDASEERTLTCDGTMVALGVLVAL